MKIQTIKNKDITEIENIQLNKILSEIQISQISKKKFILKRNEHYAVFPYNECQFDEFIGSLADLYEANKDNNYYGYSKYIVDKYQKTLRQMFTQKEIDLFPVVE